MTEGSILVTGATGTVGSEVVKQLSDKGEIIRAAARSATDNTFRNLNSVRVVQLDYNNPDTLATAFKGVEKLFLLTPPQFSTVDFTSNSVRVAKKAGVKYIVKQSVMGADAEPEIAPTPIRLHRQAEKIIEESKIPFTFLRPNFFMQNFANFYSHSIKTQGAFYVPAGDARVSFVDVRDIAAIAVHALTSNNGKHEGKAYNITGGEALSNGQAAEILSKQLGKKVNYINVSDEDARNGMKDMGMDEWTINSIMELFEFARAGYWLAISPVTEQITGNKPTSFSQFVTDYAVAFKQFRQTHIVLSHNPASPNVFGSAVNTTNPSNNTNILKLSPLSSQHIQTLGLHHHKGGQLGTSSSSNTNSTAHQIDMYYILGCGGLGEESQEYYSYCTGNTCEKWQAKET